MPLVIALQLLEKSIYYDFESVKHAWGEKSSVEKFYVGKFSSPYRFNKASWISVLSRTKWNLSHNIRMTWQEVVRLCVVMLLGILSKRWGKGIMTFKKKIREGLNKQSLSIVSCRLGCASPQNLEIPVRHSLKFNY